MAAELEPEIEFRLCGGYAVLTLNRPRKANAMDRRARQAFLAVLATAPKSCRAIVVTGAGQHFCAGIDLRERDADAAIGDHSAFGEWGDVNLAVRRHPAIFIAAVNGTALGGGLTLINCCDLAIASTRASFGMPELGFGVYPAMAGPSTQMVLARKPLAWMMFTAEAIDATQAERFGLINRVVEPTQLLAESEALAARIAGFDAAAVLASKRALDVIPSSIRDWERAFEYGALANAAIRSEQGMVAASQK